MSMGCNWNNGNEQHTSVYHPDGQVSGLSYWNISGAKANRQAMARESVIKDQLTGLTNSESVELIELQKIAMKLREMHCRGQCDDIIYFVLDFKISECTRCHMQIKKPKGECGVIVRTTRVLFSCPVTDNVVRMQSRSVTYIISWCARFSLLSIGWPGHVLGFPPTSRSRWHCVGFRSNYFTCISSSHSHSSNANIRVLFYSVVS